MKRYENKLVKWLLPVKDLEVRIRAFSHIATKPNEVSEWVPVTLKELGDTVAFDIRTCDIMKGKSVKFILTTKKVTIVHAIEIL